MHIDTLQIKMKTLSHKKFSSFLAITPFKLKQEEDTEHF